MTDLDSPSRLALFSSFVGSLQDDTAIRELLEQASGASGCPVVLLSLVMGNVQLFTAASGLAGELEITRSTSRCDSFCQFVVQQESPFIVENARDPDLDLPRYLVENHGVRAYIGVPLRVRDQVAGSLCCIDSQPRTFDADLVDELQRLAEVASSRLAAAMPVPTSVDHPAYLRARRLLIELSPLPRLLEAARRETLSPEALMSGLRALSELSTAWTELNEAVTEMGEHARASGVAAGHPRLVASR